MSVSKFTCPECETVLRPAKPLPSGKRVTCPKCKANFAVHDAEEEAVKSAKPAKKSASPAAPAKNDPFDDDGPETYGIIKEAEPEEELDEEDEDEDEDGDEDEDRPRKAKKPKKDTARSEDLEFRLNTKVTDPRGPAQAALIGPSNFLMLVATLAIIAAVLVIAYGAWPFLFAERPLDPADYFGVSNKGKDETENKGGDQSKTKMRVMPDQDGKVDLAKLDQKLQNEFYDAEDARILFLIILMASGAAVLVYNIFIIVGGVKMQNMESYTWSMVAAIMAFGPSFPGLGQIAALMAVTTLRSKKVVDGFFYIPPSATPHAKQKKKDVL
jgi:hypothetical protein